mgnify:CR=1 FL=1
MSFDQLIKFSVIDFFRYVKCRNYVYQMSPAGMVQYALGIDALQGDNG